MSKPPDETIYQMRFENPAFVWTADAMGGTPEPGSMEAVLQGCSCPPEQPGPGRCRINAACPVHPLQRTPKN